MANPGLVGCPGRCDRPQGLIVVQHRRKLPGVSSAELHSDHDSEAERFRHVRDQIILGHSRIDLNGAQFETSCFLTEAVGEEPIAIKKVA